MPIASKKELASISTFQPLDVVFDEAGRESFNICEGLFPFEPSLSAWIEQQWELLAKSYADRTDHTLENIEWQYRVSEFLNRSRRLAIPLLARYYSSEEICFITGLTSYHISTITHKN